MEGRCPNCKNKTHGHDEARYLDPHFIPPEWHTSQVRIYKFTCRSAKRCGPFFILLYYKDDDRSRSPQKWLTDDIGYWNQSQGQKPNKQMRGTTYCEWSLVVKAPTDHAYRKVLSRERFLVAHYDGVSQKKLAKENKKRITRSRRNTVLV